MITYTKAEIDFNRNSSYYFHILEKIIDVTECVITSRIWKSWNAFLDKTECDQRKLRGCEM